MSIWDWIFEGISIASSVDPCEDEYSDKGSISKNISNIRRIARKKLGRTIVNDGWLDKPLINNLSPWQLVIKGKSSEVLEFLKKK